jgi:hypothetical protein
VIKGKVKWETLREINLNLKSNIACALASKFNVHSEVGIGNLTQKDTKKNCTDLQTTSIALSLFSQ